jgi:tetratricopeptide (TPR) repeat protein
VALWLATGAAIAAEGEVSIIGTTRVEFEAVEFDGARWRTVVSDAFKAKDTPAQRIASLQPALDWCDGKQDSATQAFASVSTQAEREELLAARTDPRPVVFIDIACARAYHTAAYFAADAGEADKAMGLLERAQKLAPYWAPAYTERGFLFNARGDRQQALASYRKGLELAERYPSSANNRAVALRGIGWTLVELGDYAGARDAYERSLVVDPGNANATAELKVIDKLEAKGSAGPNTPAFSTAVKPAVDPAPVDGERERVVRFTRELEAEPFAPQAKAKRSWLIGWIEAAPDLTVTVCDTLGLVGEGKASPYDSEVVVQGMFGIAAYLIEHPESKDDAVAQQRAGVESALKAYTAILRAHPDAHVASLDAYLQHQAAGDFDGYFASILARNCSGK